MTKRLNWELCETSVMWGYVDIVHNLYLYNGIYKIAVCV